MGKPVIHVSEADAASDFASLMARVREGAQVVIEHEATPVAVLQAAQVVPRKLSECIALAKAHEESGQVPVLDADFEADVQEIVNNRKAWTPPAWE